MPHAKGRLKLQSCLKFSSLLIELKKSGLHPKLLASSIATSMLLFVLLENANNISDILIDGSACNKIGENW